MKKLLFIIIFLTFALGQVYDIGSDVHIDGDIILEGNAADANEVTITAPVVTADRTVTIPDKNLDLDNPVITSVTASGNIDAATFTGNGAALTGITGASGGVANTGSTTIGADTDANDSGIIDLQTRTISRMTVANNGEVNIINDLIVDEDVGIGGEGTFDATLWQNESFVYKGSRVEIVNPYVAKDSLFKGQIHFHSDESDGVDTPSATVTAYKNDGYDFVSLTDHDYNGVPTADPSVADILFIKGIEQTESTGHIVRTNVTNEIASTDLQAILDSSIVAGNFTSMAHPNANAAYNLTDDELAELTGYYAVEIYNTATSAGYRDATDKWDTVLSRYVKAWGTSVDDNHDITTVDFGTGAVQVHADSLTVDEIMENLKRGNYYSTYTPQDSTEIDLTVSVDKRNITATVAIADSIQFITKNGTISQAERGLSSTYEVVGNEIYVRVAVVGDSALAWSNPIYINQDSRIDKGGVIQGDVYANDNLTVKDTITVGDGTNAVIRYNSTSASNASTLEVQTNKVNDTTVLQLRPSGTTTIIPAFSIIDTSVSVTGKNNFQIGTGNATLPAETSWKIASTVIGEANSASLPIDFVLSSAVTGRRTTMSLNSSGYIGFGTVTPAFAIDIYGTGLHGALRTVSSTASSSVEGGGLVIGTNDGALMASGHRLGYITFVGAEDDADTFHSSSGIEAFATEAWSPTQNGSNLVFKTTTNGATSRTAKVTIANDGKTGIGTETPVNLFNVDGAYNFFADSSAVNDSWGFVTTGLEVLTTGMTLFVQIGKENTDGATLQINALGAKAVEKNHNVALATGDVEVGQILHLVYDGANFQMLSQLAQ